MLNDCLLLPTVTFIRSLAISFTTLQFFTPITFRPRAHGTLLTEQMATTTTSQIGLYIIKEYVWAIPWKLLLSLITVVGRHETGNIEQYVNYPQFIRKKILNQLFRIILCVRLFFSSLLCCGWFVPLASCSSIDVSISGHYIVVETECLMPATGWVEWLLLYLGPVRSIITAVNQFNDFNSHHIMVVCKRSLYACHAIYPTDINNYRSIAIEW